MTNDNKKLKTAGNAKILDDKQWKLICNYFKKHFHTPANSFSGMRYCSIATVNEDGTPHIMPIGSFFVDENKRGYYFEPYSRHTSQNLKKNQRVCVQVVNTSLWFWMRTLILAKSSAPMAMRLMGSVGEKRKATPEEIKKWHNLIKSSKPFKGARMAWFKMTDVRDIYFDSFEPVDMGPIKQTGLNELINAE
jgi:predicted pyridoxine 5'-phosphate oxidase superfamily flavin-nucleotide-binding protein